VNWNWVASHQVKAGEYCCHRSKSWCLIPWTWWCFPEGGASSFSFFLSKQISNFISSCWRDFPYPGKYSILSSLLPVVILSVVLNSIHLEGQGRQPPASQPPAVTDQPPSHHWPPAAFTLEGWIILFWIRV